MKIYFKINLRLTALCALLCTSWSKSSAQEFDEFSEAYLNRDVSYLSPTASAFNNYVSHPDVNSTGSVAIEVPIYSLQDKDNTVDIKLNYDPNRLKLDNAATWVGTGWALQAGGIITRQVKGKPDDLNYGVSAKYTTQFNPYFGLNPNVAMFGWLSPLKHESPEGSGETDFIKDFPNTRWSGYDLSLDDDAANSESWWAHDFGWAVRNSIDQLQMDTEPDIYTVSVNGESFKFVFNEMGEPKILHGMSDYKIEYLQRNAENPFGGTPRRYYPDAGRDARYVHILQWQTDIYQFKITSPNGYQYIFEEDDIEYTTRFERSLHWNGYANGTMELLEQEYPKYASAWHLSRIISPNGNEVAFEYTTHNITEAPPLPMFVGACETGGDCSTNDDWRLKYDPVDHLDDFLVDHPNMTFYFNQRHYEYWNKQQITRNEIDRRTRYKTAVKHISKIYSDIVEINFTAINPRLDLVGGYELNEILVLDRINDIPVKQFELDYTNHRDESVDTDPEIPEVWKNRLYLDRVSELSASGYSKITHGFVYNGSLPYRHSKARDAWGFFNNKDHASNIPGLYVYPDQSGVDTYRLFPIHSSIDPNYHYLPGADLSVDPVYVTRGALERVVFPTGGYRDYVFESHDYWDEKGLTNVQGGGLRIKEVRHHDGINHANDIVRTYTYREIDEGGNYPTTKSTGQVVYPPIYGNETNFYLDKGKILPEVSVGEYLNNDGWQGPEFDEYNLFTKRSTHSFNQLTDLHGNSIYYTSVRESLSPNQGNIDYEFFPPVTIKNSKAPIYLANVPGCDYCEFVTMVWPILWYLNSGGQSDHDMWRMRLNDDGLKPFSPLSDINESMTLLSGKPKSKSIFRRGFHDPLEVYTYEYTIHEKQPEFVYGVVKQQYDLMTSVTPSARYNQQIRGRQAVSKYQLSTNKEALLYRTTVQKYDKNATNSLETTEEVTYVSNHKLPRSHSLITPKETRTTEYRYPFDVTGDQLPVTIFLRGFRNLVVSNRIAEPLQTLTYLDPEHAPKKVISGQLKIPMDAHYFDSPAEGTFIETISELDLNEPVTSITNISIDYEEEDLVVSGAFQKKMEIIDYDQYGNPLEVELPNGLTRNYQWSHAYHGAYLTAESLSQHLEDELGDDFSQTYTYQPLVGILSATDENGLTTSYEYDSFERLTFIKDNDGKVTHRYNYMTVSERGDDIGCDFTMSPDDTQVSFLVVDDCASGDFIYEWKFHRDSDTLETTEPNAYHEFHWISTSERVTITLRVKNTQGDYVTPTITKSITLYD